MQESINRCTVLMRTEKSHGFCDNGRKAALDENTDLLSAQSIISQSKISSRICWLPTPDRLLLILDVQGQEMMIGLCVRTGDSAACFIHTMDVSVQSTIREYTTTALLSEGVTLLILTEPIRFFFCAVPSD